VLQFAGTAALWFGCLGMGIVVAGLHLLAAPSRQRRVAQLRAATDPAPVAAATPDVTPGVDHEVNVMIDGSASRFECNG